ncbi:MAG: hypothetical protein V1787_02125 [Candidatus Micrarchaeota archaeon]
MVCYAVPLSAAILLHAARKKGRLKGEGIGRLNLLMAGGAAFGVVDHWWNGELFLFGPGMGADLALGFVITAAIAGFWAASEILSPAPQAART